MRRIDLTRASFVLSALMLLAALKLALLLFLPAVAFAQSPGVPPAAVDPTQLLAQIFDAVHNGNGWLAAGPALSLVVWALMKYDKSIPKVGPAIDGFLNQPLVAFMLPAVLSAATGLFGALAQHQAIGPAMLTSLKVAALAAFTFLGLKNAAEQSKTAPTPEVPPAAPKLLVLALGLSLLGGSLQSCTHVEPLLVTKDTIVGADKTFLATRVVMKGLQPQLSPAMWQSWLLFEQRFATSFHAARVLYEDAEAAEELAVQADGGTAQANLRAAEQIAGSLIAQLGYWEGVEAQLLHPDGGHP